MVKRFLQLLTSCPTLTSICGGAATTPSSEIALNRTALFISLKLKGGGFYTFYRMGRHGTSARIASFINLTNVCALFCMRLGGSSSAGGYMPINLRFDQSHRALPPHVSPPAVHVCSAGALRGRNNPSAAAGGGSGPCVPHTALCTTHSTCVPSQHSCTTHGTRVPHTATTHGTRVPRTALVYHARHSCTTHGTRVLHTALVYHARHLCITHGTRVPRTALVYLCSLLCLALSLMLSSLSHA